MEIGLDILLSAFAALLIGAVASYLIMKNSATHKTQFLAHEIEELKNRHMHEVEELKAQIEEVKKHGLSVVCYPYDEERGDDGFITDDRFAEVGYKFQLFVDGIPCFEAHKVPIKTLHKKEVSFAKIAKIKEEVISLIETLASKHPAIAISKAAANSLVK
jgi:hypothetical protein